MEKKDVNEKLKPDPQLFLKEAKYYETFKKTYVRCNLCFRKCIIADNHTGFCRVRKNLNGKLYSLVYSLPSAIHVDPIEKEPLYHFLPATEILCLGTVGCNFECKHCHNWHLSQAKPGDTETYYFTPEQVIDFAIKNHIPTISFTYNDPIVCYEYLYDVAKLAKKNDLNVIFHSNGSMNPEPLQNLLKYIDGATIDLKGFTEEAYKNSSARLEPVLKSLKIIKKSNIWLEIVNLVIPSINDDMNDIRNMCIWIRDNLGDNVPLHFSRFFPCYKLTKLYPTPIETLEKAYSIAKEAGLKYVTIGNVPGHNYNSTFCPNCSKRVIYRSHFEVIENNIIKGKCKFCDYKIPGFWEE